MFFPAELRPSVVARDAAALERLITEGNDITKQAWAKVALAYVTRVKIDRNELQKEAILGPYTQLEEVTSLDQNNPPANQPVVLAASLVKLQLALLRPNLLPKAITEKLNVFTGLNALREKVLPGPLLNEIDFCIAQIHFEGGHTVKHIADIQKAMPIFESLPVNDLTDHLKNKLQTYINTFKREQDRQKFWLTHNVPGSMPALQKPAAAARPAAQPVPPVQPINPGHAVALRAQELQKQYAALGLIPVRSALQPQPAAAIPDFVARTAPQAQPQPPAHMSPPAPRPAAASAPKPDEIIDAKQATSARGTELKYLSTAKKPAGKKEKTRTRTDLETNTPAPPSSYARVSAQFPPMPTAVLAKPAPAAAPVNTSVVPAVPASPLSGLSALTLAAESVANSGAMGTDESQERGTKYAKK